MKRQNATQQRSMLVGLRENVWKIYLIRALVVSMGISIPTIVLFWQEHGLSMSDVMVLQAIFAAALAAFEVPSGYVADMYGRKQTIIAAAGCLAAGALVYSFASTFSGFLGAELLLAIGFSLVSGADQALVYDSLLTLRRVGLYQRLWGVTSAIEALSAAFGCIIGGFIAAVNLRLPFLFVTVGYIAMFIVALTLREPERVKRVVTRGHLREFGGIASHCLFKNRVLGWLMLFSAIMLGFNQVGLWLYQPYFALAEIPVVHFGWLFAVMNLFSAGVSSCAYRLERSLGVYRSCILSLTVLVVGYLVLGSTASVWTVAVILTHQFVRGFGRVVFSDYVNRHTASDVRATSISLKSMVERVVYITALLPAGMIADAYGVLATFQALGLAVLVVGSVAILVRPERAQAVEREAAVALQEGC